MIVRRLIGTAVMVIAATQAGLATRNLWTINDALTDPVSAFFTREFLESAWTENLIWLICSVLAIGVGAWWCRPGTMLGLKSK